MRKLLTATAITLSLAVPAQAQMFGVFGPGPSWRPSWAAASRFANWGSRPQVAGYGPYATGGYGPPGVMGGNAPGFYGPWAGGGGGWGPGYLPIGGMGGLGMLGGLFGGGIGGGVPMGPPPVSPGTGPGYYGPGVSYGAPNAYAQRRARIIAEGEGRIPQPVAANVQAIPVYPTRNVMPGCYRALVTGPYGGQAYRTICN